MAVPPMARPKRGMVPEFTMLARALRPMILALMVAGLCSLGLTACNNPCEDLANRLCNAPGCDPTQCERWHERTARVPTETCEAGLRSLDRERVR